MERELRKAIEKADVTLTVLRLYKEVATSSHL